LDAGRPGRRRGATGGARLGAEHFAARQLRALVVEIRVSRTQLDTLATVAAPAVSGTAGVRSGLCAAGAAASA
jgi:hypothetical protein